MGETGKGQYEHMENEGSFCASGATMLVQEVLLRVFRDTDYFDPGPFAYHEDVDICWFACMLGFEVSICPEAVCYHRGGSSLKGDKSLTIRYYVQRNNIRVLMKNYSLGSIVMVLPSSVVVDFLIAVLLAVYHRNLKHLRVLAESIL